MTTSVSDISREKSAELFEKAKQYFPGGVNSPVRAFKSVYGTPLFIERGDRAHLWDADGNEFIDYCCSWGPLILGHNNPEIREAVQNQLGKGLSFGAPTALENELAELILNNNKKIEKISKIIYCNLQCVGYCFCNNWSPYRYHCCKSHWSFGHYFLRINVVV